MGIDSGRAEKVISKYLKEYEHRLGKRTVETSYYFPPQGTFNAFHHAMVTAEKAGYAYGSAQRERPIALWKDAEYIAKWDNISTEELESVEGLIIADGGFREGGAIVVIFDK